MDPNQLLKDELEFELHCRGIYDVKTCAPMRKILREIFAQEASGATSIKLVAPRDSLEQPLVEMGTCESKCCALAVALEEIRDNPDQSSLKRIHTRVSHLSHRIGYICPKEDDLQMRYSLIKKSIQHLVDTIISIRSADDVEGQDEISQHDKEILQKSLGEEGLKIIEGIELGSSDPEKEITVEPVLTDVLVSNKIQDKLASSSRRHSLVRTSTIDNVRPRGKLVPVKDWGVKFTGKNNTSINAFLERLNELKDARNAEDVDLYRYAIDLFEEDALIWFRANRDSIHNWGELVELLLVTFQKPSYQDELMDEIRKRTQGRHEKAVIFIATVQNMFNRLPIKLTEQQKLSILRKNLHPYYQQTICRDKFNTVSELIQVLRIIEHTKENCENFREPETHAQHLEPDLAFQGNRYGTVNAIQETNYQSVSGNRYGAVNAVQETNYQPVSNNLPPSKCWNCRAPGHRFRECTLPQQRLFCYRCGKFGETTKKCSCVSFGISGNAQQGDSPTGRLP